MARRDYEVQVEDDLASDPHTLLFGPDDGQPAPGGRHARHTAPSEPRNSRRRRRGRRLMWLLSALVVVVVAISVAIVAPSVTSLVKAPDYSGAGSGTATIVVHQGDTAASIAATLSKADVVKSTRAFVDAAKADPDSKQIRPGTYVLHEHMSAKSALALLLDPSARAAGADVLVIEGATVFDVSRRLTKALGTDQRDAVNKAIHDVAALGVPLGYGSGGGAPSSVEGFLFPATYAIAPRTSPTQALQKMTSRFADVDRNLGFATDAKKLGLTPYQALIIASIVQSEAKFPADMAKVARVVLNRIAAERPLQIDATTRYGALVQGLNPDKVNYATFATPYNSYTHDGLPPTPISNPGKAALKAAVHPTPGKWMYYVNGDAAGHLFFTASEAAFARAAARCRENNWGCG